MKILSKEEITPATWGNALVCLKIWACCW